MSILTCSEWRKALSIEDVEMTGGAVPRTEKQINQLWEIYKDHNAVYKLISPRYQGFTFE